MKYYRLIDRSDVYSSLICEEPHLLSYIVSLVYQIIWNLLINKWDVYSNVKIIRRNDQKLY
jgi:hypothetical protein